MFPTRYFNPRYWATRYFPKVGVNIVIAVPITALEGAYEPSTTLTGTYTTTLALTGTVDL